MHSNLPRHVALEIKDVIPHGRFGCVRLALQRLNDGTVLLQHIAMMVRVAQRNEPKSKRAFVQVSQYIREYRILGRAR